MQGNLIVNVTSDSNSYIFLIYLVEFYFTMYLNLSIVTCSKGPFVHSAVASVASHSVT